ncbi:MAG: T9SS type A sorting domain-containing protein, partial [Candidatus Palauibacterales bacterium]|nr:T9SS type A sorting domain-containing protein [Candidatus Palauibacterales bacterium]
SGLRNPLVPGLTIGWSVANNTAATGPVDLTQVHTVPDPYLATSQYDLSPTTKQLMFVNLPPQATIRIYTLTGVLVDVVNHNDSSGGGREVWDLRNRNNQFVASGVYFFHVVTPDGDEYVGKFTVVNFAGQN